MIRNKNRIIVFTAEFAPMIGGLATYTEGICRGLISCGVEAIVLAPFTYKKGFSDTYYYQLGLKVFRYPNILFLREIILIPYLACLIVTQNIRRILCISWYPCGLIAMVNKWFLGIDYAVKVFGSDIIRKDVSRSKLRHQLKRKFFWLMRSVFNQASFIFPNSNYSSRLLDGLAITPEKIKVVNPGVDTVKFSCCSNTDSAKAEYNFLGRDVLLTVARLEDYKGQDMVIAALAKVTQRLPNIIYLIVGQGPDENKLQALVKHYNLEKNVVFIKGVSQAQLVQLYTLASIFVMTSREMPKRVEVEGFGIVFLEANACGKPVIGGNSGGIADVIIHGQTGLIVDPLDAEAIASAILKLLLDKDYARQLGTRAQQRVRQDFTWDQAAQKIWQAMD